MTVRRGSPSASDYLIWILDPFFKWWWAGLTGLASILAFIWTPNSGILLSPTQVVLSIFFGFAVIFLGLTTVTQGWRLYFDRNRPLRVRTAQRSTDFNAELLFTIEGFSREGGEVLIEIRRLHNGAELPFCIVKVINHTEEGHVQAIPIWISPGHLRAFSRHEFEARDLRATYVVTYDRILEAMREKIVGSLDATN